MMNKIYTIKIAKQVLILLLITALSGCKFTSDEIYGKWRTVHIYNNKGIILDNDFEKNGWFPKYNRTKLLVLDRATDSLVLYLGWHSDPPVVAKFKKNKKDQNMYYTIYNSTDERFNGIYNKKIEIDTIYQEGIQVAYYYLTLESETTKIMAIKNKSLNW